MTKISFGDVDHFREKVPSNPFYLKINRLSCCGLKLVFDFNCQRRRVPVFLDRNIARGYVGPTAFRPQLPAA